MSKVNKILPRLFVAPFYFSSYSNAMENSEGKSSEFSYHSPFSSSIYSPAVSDLGFKLGASNDHETQPFQSQCSPIVSDPGFKLGPSNENKTPEVKKIELKISGLSIEFGTDDKYIGNLIKSHKRAKSFELVNETYCLDYTSVYEVVSDLSENCDAQPNVQPRTIIAKIQQQQGS